LRLYFAGVGIACLIAAVWLTVRRVRVVWSGRIAVGRVVAFETRTDEESVSYLPVVAFVDEHGSQRRFTSVAGGSRRPAIGSAVTVRYLRDDSNTAYVSSFLHMWAAPLAFAILGVVALLASARG